jgi:soluble lytic murein transglycosylase-like protein
MRKSLAVLAVLAVLALGGQAAAHKAKPAAASVSAPGTHKVVRGDNLSRIAAKHGTTVAELVRINSIRKPNQIRIGTVLTLPAQVQAAAKSGDPRLPARLRELPDRQALLPVFDAAAAKHKVPADLLKAVTWMESGWQNHKVSSTKAVGIGQLMPATVEFVNGVLLRGAKLDPKKPADNINISARYLNWLLTQTKGDVRQAVSGYYQGLASVRRQGPLAETTVYADSVIALRSRF